MGKKRGFTWRRTAQYESAMYGHPHRHTFQLLLLALTFSSSGLAHSGVLRSLKANSGISALILEVSLNVQSSDERWARLLVRSAVTMIFAKSVLQPVPIYLWRGEIRLAGALL